MKKLFPPACFLSDFIQSRISVFSLLVLCTFFAALLLSHQPVWGATVPASKISLLTYQNYAPLLTSKLRQHGISFGSPIFIRIFKEEAELELWIKDNDTYTLFKTYLICDYSGKLGPKIKQGDLQSPEGFYSVKVSQMNPWSDYHLAFDLGYPNGHDRSRNWNGSGIMVHGRCYSTGCFAMSNHRMDEIYTLAEAALTKGQKSIPVHIFPFRMTRDNLKRFRANRWFPFWQNLKEGYDIFEQDKVPPLVGVLNKKYVFGKSVFPQLVKNEKPKMKITERRNSSRVQLQASVVLTTGDKIFAAEADLKDISLDGISFRSSNGMELNSIYNVEITLTGSSSVLKISAKGRVLRQDSQLTAIKFTELDMDSYMHLKNIMMVNRKPESS